MYPVPRQAALVLSNQERTSLLMLTIGKLLKAINRGIHIAK
jgi:hypothetical protein